jgi:UMF1 family MFS transporter
VFYDALLPHIAAPDEVDKVSTTGYALGYLGGGLLLALNLALIQYPTIFGLPGGDAVTTSQSTLPTRLAFLSVAVWWAAFSLPLFLKVPEPSIKEAALPARGGCAYKSWTYLKEIWLGLLKYPQAGWMLAAFLLYNEGIGTIIKMAAIYGAELGLKSGVMIGSILIVQFVGIPCTILFGSLAARLGTRRTIFIGLAVYLGIAAVGYSMRTEAHFVVLALLVGMVQGGTQGLSRSLFASLIPKERSAQFFGLFALSEKLAGILGPALFIATIWLTGSSRNAIASVVVFFLLGGLLLLKVDVEQGRRIAKA